MPLLLTAALVASAANLPTCSWDHPGAGPYMGSMAAAVDRYSDIPQPVRDVLKARMARHQYDEIAAIRRDTITGKSRYAPELRQMHFGAGQVCGTVTRSRWSDSAVERGLVYCESGHCLIVPTVCRNVSRVTRLGPAEASGANKEASTPMAPASTADAQPTVVANNEAPATELQFDAPGAGPSFAEQADRGSVAGALGGLAGGAASPPYTAPGPGFAGGGGTGGVNDGGTPQTPVGPLSKPSGGVPDAPGPSWPLDPPGSGIGEGGIVGLPPGPLPAVPEPRSAVLTLIGLLGLAAAVRRRRR